jgi:hypothetical protein
MLHPPIVGEAEICCNPRRICLSANLCAFVQEYVFNFRLVMYRVDDLNSWIYMLGLTTYKGFNVYIELQIFRLDIEN